MSAARQLSCKEAGGLLVFYACGETSERETAQIEAHLATCADCAAQLTEERSLHEALMEALQASEHTDTGGILLSQCRSELAEALDDLAAPVAEERWRPFRWVTRWIVVHPALACSALLAMGAVLGTQVLPRLTALLSSPGDVQTVTVLPAARLSDAQLASMAVAGVNVAPAPGGAPGTVQLHVRTEEPMVLSGSVDDPDLRRVLTYVVENGKQTDPGVRLDCLEALRGRASDADVRRALLIAARRDQNPAVRMKALESLGDAVSDKAVRETLVDALQHDANPGVRVEAVSLLVRSLEQSAAEPPASPGALLAPEGLDRALNPAMADVIHTLEELQRSDPNRYVRLRSAAALRQLGPQEVQREVQ